jgi:hypothetical protein
MGLSSLFFSPAYVGCGILVLRRTSSRFGLSAQLYLLLCSVPENTYLLTLLSGEATHAVIPAQVLVTTVSGNLISERLPPDAQLQSVN